MPNDARLVLAVLEAKDDYTAKQSWTKQAAASPRPGEATQVAQSAMRSSRQQNIRRQQVLQGLRGVSRIADIVVYECGDTTEEVMVDHEANISDRYKYDSQSKCPNSEKGFEVTPAAH